MAKSVKRIPATEAKNHFGRVVQEVAASGTPVVIQSRGEDQVATVSLHDLRRLASFDEGTPTPARGRVRAALRAAGLLSEPAPDIRRRAEAYSSRHTPEVQDQILSELRGLRLKPSLSDIILESRSWRPSSNRTGK